MSRMKLFSIGFLVALVALVLGADVSLQAAEHGYVGVATCGMCHKTAKQGEQLKVWEASKHAQAFKALLTDEAKKIAQGKGIAGTPDKAAACLKCHATGHDLDAARLGAKFKVDDGVQCETCHGPGSEYKSMKVMKDKAAAVQAGLILHEKPEELCKTCHNSESPTFKEFDFAKMWPKIAHPVPKP